MNDVQETIVAIASPPGTGAIAIIRLSGVHAFAVADAVFSSRKGSLSTAPSHTALFGTIHESETVIDEVLALVFKGSNSFTGEDTVEFTCHGSGYIQQRILNLILSNGARLAKPGEFSMRAFLNRKLDLTQAEAIGDLIAADSAAAHTLAINQMRGGFSNELQILREKLINFASLLELELDFSEEDVEFADRDQLIELIHATIARIVKLSDSFEQGNVIKSGIPVAIAGKPNAGKSTLLNLILNEERAIVSEIAGTTRDTIEEEITLGGIKYRFIDTAGIRETTDTIEQMGVGRSWEKIKKALIIIYLFDPGEMSQDELIEILSDIGERKKHEKHILIPVANKSDKYNVDFMKQQFASVTGIQFISAKEHKGINELINAIASYQSKTDLNNNDVILTNARHKESLDATASALRLAVKGLNSGLSTELVSLEIRSALMHLGNITGAITTDDLLESIFTKFCIGK